MNFAVYLLGYLTFSVIHAQDIPFASVSTLNGQTMIVEGDTVQLKCSYSPDKVKHMGWYHICENLQGDCKARDLGRVVYGYSTVSSLYSNGTNAWLNRAFGREMSDGYYITLKNVRLTDKGLYICVTFENELGVDRKDSNPVELVVADGSLSGTTVSDIENEEVAEENNNLVTLQSDMVIHTTLSDYEVFVDLEHSSTYENTASEKPKSVIIQNWSIVRKKPTYTPTANRDGHVTSQTHTYSPVTDENEFTVTGLSGQIATIGFILAAISFVIIILLVIAFTVFFLQRKRKLLMQQGNAPTIAATVKDGEVTLQEANALASDVDESEYEYLTPDDIAPMADTKGKWKVPVYVNMAESNMSSDGYMMAQTLNEGDKPHVYVQLTNDK